MKNTTFLGTRSRWLCVRPLVCIAIVAVIALAFPALSLTGCDDGSPAALKTPVADDFEVGNLSQVLGNVTPVTVTAKPGKSPGAVTVYYTGSGTLPLELGSYAVTFNVAAAKNWKAAKGLVGGTLWIRLAGAVVGAPAVESVTHNSVTLNAVTAPDNGQTVEYARSGTETAPISGWQASTTFTGLNAGTTYYFFARAAANDTYGESTASSGTPATTKQQTEITAGLEDSNDGIVIEADGESISGNAFTVKAGDTVTFSAGENYDRYRWTLNGSTAGTDNTFKFDTAGLKGDRDYLVGLMAEKDGRYYFTQITVKVEEDKEGSENEE